MTVRVLKISWGTLPDMDHVSLIKSSNFQPSRYFNDVKLCFPYYMLVDLYGYRYIFQNNFQGDIRILIQFISNKVSIRF